MWAFQKAPSKGLAQPAALPASPSAARGEAMDVTRMETPGAIPEPWVRPFRAPD